MIPNFRELTVPLLVLLRSGEKKKASAIVRELADYLRLSEDERQELLPSGKLKKFDDRGRWALYVLRRRGLLQNFQKGYYQITEEGRSALKDKLTWQQISALPKTERVSGEEDSNEDAKGENSDKTPEEEMADGYLKYRAALRDDILMRVKKITPREFESLVVELMLKMGYGGTSEDAGRAIGQSGDGGVDGVIKEDILGLDLIYLQAKRWENSVGRPVVQQFAGSLMGKKAQKGVIITTSSFTKEARDYVNHIEQKISLIDGEMLANFMIDHGLGVSLNKSYLLMKLDDDFFSDE